MNLPVLSTGVWGVLATPFTGSAFDVDKTSLGRLVEYYEQCGVTGLTVLGVFGEAARLSAKERRAVLGTVVDAVDLPLVVGITSLATAPVIEEARQAQDVVAGGTLAGVMVQVNAPNPDVLRAHLQAVHDATGVGIVVQDYPVASGVQISTRALIEAIQPLGFVVAVKAEAPPTPVAIAALTAKLNIPVFGGLGGMWLLDELAAGAAGAMTGFSFPEGLIATVEAWHAGGYDRARDVWLKYLPLANFEQQATVALAIRKECLRQRGLLLESGVRPPAAVLPESLNIQLKRHLTAVPQPEGGR
jgi:4-hydroxy-tetrahydrodipicolinate synthase